MNTNQSDLASLSLSIVVLDKEMEDLLAKVVMVMVGVVMMVVVS